MSTTEEDQRKEYVSGEPSIVVQGAPRQVTTVSQSSDGTVRQVVEQPAVQPVVQATSPVERESVVKHTRTNNSAIVGMAIGIVVLAIGLLLVWRETPFLPYPWSIFAVLAVGVALIGVGASLISNRST